MTTPAHAEGITATEQDQARTEGVEAAVALMAAELWHDSNPGVPINADCTAWQECMGIARRAVAAAAPIIAAAERERIALALEAEEQPDCGNPRHQARTYLSPAQAAAIARDETSEVPNG